MKVKMDSTSDHSPFDLEEHKSVIQNLEDEQSVINEFIRPMPIIEKGNVFVKPLSKKDEDELFKESSSLHQSETETEESSSIDEDNLSKLTSPVEEDKEFGKPVSTHEDVFIKPATTILRPLKKRSSSSLQFKQNVESKEKTEKSPSQSIAEKEIPIPYKEPPWSGLPHQSYQFEVIKNGVIIENISFDKSYMVVGRLSNCDIILEHPSISRFHCVIQYRAEGSKEEPPGLYVQDLDSTHGTFQNKHRLEPKKFNRVRVGHILKFGGSTRMFVLQGPDEDQQPEMEVTVSELMAKAKEKKLKLKELETGELDTKDLEDKKVSEKEDDGQPTEGIDWGLGEDAQEDEDDDEDPDNFENPFCAKEELYLTDPKKSLRGWYEREGYDLPDYKLEEIKQGHFRGKLELPVRGPGGKPIVCIVEHKGKKKDTVVQCALEACRTLDRHGMLRQATHESQQKKRKDWSENDYYDSDEDDFLDRTGDIEKKRRLRKVEVEAAKGKMKDVETYESLSKQYSEVVMKLESIEKNLKRVEDLKKEQNDASSDAAAFSDADELEAYMNHLSSQLPDKHKRIGWKLEAVQLMKEEVRLRKLVNVARPLGVPEIPERASHVSEDKKLPPQKHLPKTDVHIGKRKGAPAARVHAAFLEEEEESKPKLRKVKCDVDDDDEGSVRPVPYSKPQKVIDKYRQRFNSTKRASLHKPPLSSPVKEPEVPPTTYSDEQTPRGDQTRDSSHSHMTDADEAEGERAKDSTPLEQLKPEESSKERLIGPTLPSSVTSSLEFAKPKVDSPSSKAKAKQEKKKKKAKASPFAFEEQYETWTPPQGQTGDGRTALNDRFGY